MNSKPNIIIDLDYNQDYLIPFIKCISRTINIYFIHYSSPLEVKTNSYKEFGRILFWKDFKDSYDLLEKINPYKVVFFELETLNQVSLNSACKASNIITAFCDHGIKNLQSIRRVEKVGSQKLTFKLKKRICRNPIHTIRNRQFFDRTVKKSDKETESFLTHYKKIRLSNSISNTYLTIKDERLYPNEYYCLNQNNVDFHKLQNHKAQAEYFVYGLPDNDQIGTAIFTDEKYLLYVDQPYCSKTLCGWSYEIKMRWIKSLAEICRENDLMLLIKKHPREIIDWRPLEKVSNIEWTEESIKKKLEETVLVIGFNSTLLLSIASLAHTVVLCIKYHPDGSLNENGLLVTEKVANWLPDLGALNNIIQNRQQIHKTQSAYKKKFISYWMYKNDGNAIKRLQRLYLKDIP